MYTPCNHIHVAKGLCFRLVDPWFDPFAYMKYKH